MENVVMILFDVESEAYQALAELKRNPINADYTISQMGLVQNKDGRILALEGFDSGVETRDDAFAGGLIGGFIGILGGPIGVLFSGSVGALIGSAIDVGDAERNMSMLECVSGKLQGDQVALIVLIQENSEEALDNRVAKFRTEVLRWDAAVIAQEVQEAQKLEKEMRKLAKERMRNEKKEGIKQNLEQNRAKIQAHFEVLKEKFKK